jgi:hypothetical protein
MKLYPFYISVLIMSTGVFFGCGNSSEEQLDNTPENTFLQNSYGTKAGGIPALSEAVKNHVAQWSVFEDFEKEARSTNGSSLERLRNISERLVQYSDSLSKKIPDTLSNNAIRSRLTVVNSRANLLFQEVRKSRLDSLIGGRTPARTLLCAKVRNQQHIRRHCGFDRGLGLAPAKSARRARTR